MPQETTEKKVLEFVTSPIMLAAWPGPGNVGAMALDYLRYMIEAEPLEHLDMSALYSPSSIQIREGKFMRPAAPEGNYYLKRNPALILFECDTQFAEKESLLLVHHVVNTAKQWGVSRIITVGGMPSVMDHHERSDVHFASSEEGLSRELETAGFTPIPKGEIAGPVGLVPSVAASLGINAACILATMPVYASAIVYPKASLALLSGLERLLHIHLDLSHIERAIEQMEEMYKGIEEQIRERFPTILTPTEPTPDEEPGEMAPAAAPVELPRPLRIKIEALFKEAVQDRSKATDLKRMLDERGIFKLFEDRFLDLFKEGEGRE